MGPSSLIVELCRFALTVIDRRTLLWVPDSHRFGRHQLHGARGVCVQRTGLAIVDVVGALMLAYRIRSSDDRRATGQRDG